MELYCIELNRKSNRKYISYVDDCWYQTTFDPLYLWTEEECRNLLPSFIKSFIWGFDIVDRSGNRKHIGASDGLEYKDNKIVGGLNMTINLSSLSNLK